MFCWKRSIWEVEIQEAACGEEPLTVGRLVGFHALSFHNGHVVNSNVPFDSRATDPFKDELEKGISEGDK